MTVTYQEHRYVPDLGRCAICKKPEIEHIEEALFEARLKFEQELKEKPLVTLADIWPE